MNQSKNNNNPDVQTKSDNHKSLIKFCNDAVGTLELCVSQMTESAESIIFKANSVIKEDLFHQIRDCLNPVYGTIQLIQLKHGQPNDSLKTLSDSIDKTINTLKIE